jgi:N utilization substance protein B
MQTLYALESSSPEDIKLSPEKILASKIEQTRNLFGYVMHFIFEVARYAETDARIKGNKHLPTAEDLSINTKIAGNELMWQTLENSSFQQVKKRRCFRLTGMEFWQIPGR